MDLEFRTQNEQLCTAIQEFVQSFIHSHENMKTQKVIQIADDKTITKLRKVDIPKEGRPVKEIISEMMNEVYSNQAIMQHPRCFAFIPSPISLYSWLGDIMTSAYNPHAGSWMQSSSASCIEQKVIEWMCMQAGYPNTSGGIFVSGGSMANLTALTVARNVKLSEDNYGKGVAYVSEQTHSSVSKGLRIIGFRANQIRKIPTDAAFRMDMLALKEAITADLDSGNIPFAIIATAGTTNTGSIDPLNEIAGLCKKYNIWLHVDGAYGASILASSKYKKLLNGIEHSDSISWDAHKWLMQSYGCSAILIKDKKNLVNCFHTHPEYLNDATIEDDQTNYWDLGPELTRPARSLKLWVTMQIMGTDAISNVIEHGFQLTEWAEDELKKYQHWEIISPAQQAIINFRYSPPRLTEQQLDALNQHISHEILNNGYAGILTTELKGKKVLRICAIHPETTEEDIRSTVKLLDHYACKIYNDMIF
jgi:glutamate/tyrosine decarboxylase-like PLP-dependent enzyme